MLAQAEVPLETLAQILAKAKFTAKFSELEVQQVRAVHKIGLHWTTGSLNYVNGGTVHFTVSFLCSARDRRWIEFWLKFPQIHCPSVLEASTKSVLQTKQRAFELVERSLHRG